MATIQERNNQLQKTNTVLMDNANDQKQRIEQLENALQKLVDEKNDLESTYQRKLDVSFTDYFTDGHI